jgi:oxygen-dependent protoporphyrinogen oxidase
VGVRAAPAWEARAVWREAIPQYALGYGRVRAALDRVEAERPGLALAGSFRHGVALGEAFGSGTRAAARLLGTDG